MSLIGVAIAATVSGTNGVAVLNNDYFQYSATDPALSYKNAQDGMIATSEATPDGQIRLKFNTPLNPNLRQFDIVAASGAYSTNDSFEFRAVSFSIAANTTGYIGKTVSLDLSKYQTDDLIVLAVKVDGTIAVQELRVEFDVDGSGYTSSYYYKSIIPVAYQGSLSLPQTNDPTQAMSDAVSDLALGIQDQGKTNSFLRSVIDIIGGDLQAQVNQNGVNGIQPAQMASGDGPWSVIYLRKGDFQPVGNAGSPGLDWSNITGWRIQVTTNNQGSATLAFNGLYIQGSPTLTGEGTNAGASSYGGSGYDFRYTYWNNDTFTESNPCGEAYFSVIPENPAGASTLIVLRQAINLEMLYSGDPQVTHVKIYARGGAFGKDWTYADRIPNITGVASFDYRYILPDSARAQGDILQLDNDVPVTSTLQNPISTTVSNAGGVSPYPPNTNNPDLVLITTADVDAVFVPYQVVVIGTPQNLEEVLVVTGGTGQFYAYIQLVHPQGDPVQAFSVPAQPCNLAAVAYGQLWYAGDKNNPHMLYRAKIGYPENVPPQNYTPMPGGPGDPISAVINYRGTLFVRTYSTWYQIFPGSPPYAQSTGSKHGSPASFDWCLTESEIWYQSWDGIRTFVGADGKYRSLLIEWLFRDNAMTPIPLVELTQLRNTVSAFRNNTATFCYFGQDGKYHRIRYSTSYQRWRNDDLDCRAIFVEQDTNLLVYTYPVIVSGVITGWAIAYEDITKDYDDGGWINGVLQRLPIAVDLLTPYNDQSAPNNEKQYNVLVIDANPNGQTLSVRLLFDDNNGTVSPVTPSPAVFTGSVRDKFNFQINAGDGQEAYRVALEITGSVTSAPVIYQADLYAAVLPDWRTSYDSYWIKFSVDESKLVKQGYFDYTSEGPVTVQLFADGSDIPYYTFTLPANATRTEVPMRVRFPAMKLRMLRVVMTSDSKFRIWSELTVEQKPVMQGKSYARSTVGSLSA